MFENAKSTLDDLFRPFTLNGLTVPNRFMTAPMTREFSPGVCRPTTWRPIVL